MSAFEVPDENESFDIAIIGVNGRFPGARNIAEFWQNLQQGVEAISFFSDEEVAAAGVPEEIYQNPHYVKAGGVLEDVDLFDASFFGFYPREAALMDPQHRVFLESAWEALETAGYDPERYDGLVGVFASTSMNTYLLFNLNEELDVIGSADVYGLAIGNDKDFLPTRVSYKLNLRGPSFNVQSACSSSLVAAHLACQSLINYQCDIALAGGVAITLPQKRGYLYQEGGIASPDGHCRPFDAQAQGTVPGSGVGIVVLKRLTDAIEDGDHIYAVIKGTAINNDGSLKVGYTAPSVGGQADVIATGQMLAGVDPETIGYIEAHGTGTVLGDPIEVSALTQVFRDSTEAKQFCAIGSVKSNVGHLDAAAGVTGLIKAALALYHKQIPPSINFTLPNPQIDFANSPFYVNDELADWQTNGLPRRAGVSSFGIGGTNAHALLQEAPQTAASSPSRPFQLILLSTKSDQALDAATWNLADYLMQHDDANLADVAYTLQVGRRVFNYRRAAVVGSVAEGIEALGTPDPQRVFTEHQEMEQRPVAFMFTGQGAQYVGMGRDLYETEPIFRETVDACSEFLAPLLDLDLRDLLFAREEKAEEAAELLKQTYITQPALFVIEYALAQLWQEWGVFPTAMIGHSIGEYVAACLSGVFSLEDALELVTVRGRLMQDLPGGAMLSVSLPETELRPFLNGELSLAAVNAPNLSVVSGPHAAIDALAAQLATRDIACRQLRTSHAFHSAMMEPILAPFAERVAAMALQAPEIPFVSNVTGEWITAAEATDPAYWTSHLRQAVRFADGLEALLEEPNLVLLEVGPGRTLATLARQHAAVARQQPVLTSLRHPRESHSDVAFILTTLGKLWLAGVEIDWQGFYAYEQRRRVPLPTYPFERKRYWIEPQGKKQVGSKALHKRANIDNWFYVPSWQRSATPVAAATADPQRWLCFVDENVGPEIVARLAANNHSLVTVTAGQEFARLADGRFTVRPQQREDYAALLAALDAQGFQPQRILHLWSAAPQTDLTAAQEGGFYSLLALAQALGRQEAAEPIQLDVVATNLHDVTGSEALQPESAAVLGICRVLPQEYPHVTCRVIDLADPTAQAEALLRELTGAATDTVVAYRGRHRWAQTFTAAPRPGGDALTHLRREGVYLITGGLGRIGLVFAEYLAHAVQARLVLVDRTGLPERAEWEAWPADHDADDPTGRRIAAVQALEALGAEVLVATADVSDATAMAQAIAEAEARFGALHGVIHAAGLVGDAAVTPLQLATPDACEAQFAPKIQGVLVLEQVLNGRQLDFVLLQSSLSSILGGLGFAAYAAANAFMDAVAHRHQDGSPWISVNWDGWQFSEETRTRTGLTEFNIVPEEGVQALARILAHPLPPQLVVSTADLQERLQRYVTRETAAEDSEATAERYERPELDTVYAAPRNDLEATIAAMWQKVLGLDQVGIYDDFFELGGHSLLATQIISRLRDMYDVELPLRDIFERPTVAGLAELIETARTETATAATAAPITPIPRKAVLPLSFGQQRLWFLDQLEPGSPLYNNFTAVRLSGTLDVAVLTQTLNEIVRRHEILRSTFVERDGEPVQVVAPELTLEIPLRDLQHLSGDEQTAEIERLAIEEGRHPFDLTQGPLLRVRLLRLAEDEHVAFMTMHHIVSDGWSVAVLVQETVALYAAFSAGEPSPLPRLAVQYADYAAWQRDWLQGDVLETQLAYWRDQLRDAPALELPTDYPRPPVQTAAGANAWFELPPALHADLQALAQAEGATLFMVLTAALQTLLYRYSGQDDITLGTPVANRNRSETEGLIGFLLNTLVLRTDLSGDEAGTAPTFRELLARVRETALAAYDHQDVPFEMLVEKLQPQRDMSRSPFFQVMFDLQKAQLPRLELADVSFAQLRIDNGTAKFDLALSMEEAPDKLYGYLNYNTDLFRAETIGRMLDHFQTLLQGIVADPDRPLADLPLLTEVEVHQLDAWSQTAVAPRPYRSVMEHIAEQAAQRPDATALVLDDAKLTYAELNGRANRLAHFLQQQGIGPKTVVGLYAERSLEAIVGLLGILKAGGVYLPLEPSLPQERLAFMVEDARVDVLLTQESLARSLALETHPTLICLDSDWCEIARQPETEPAVAAATADPAYIIYTSGSTGQPKGVVISHEAIARHTVDVADHFGLTVDDRVLQFAALSFDQSIEQILATLVTGATLVLRGPEVWPPVDFAQVIIKHGLTVINLPPAYWNQWVQTAVDTFATIPANQLRLVIIGGDVMLGESLRLWQETPLAGARLLNAYGPTETTITALTYEVTPPVDAARIPIGRPLPNRVIYVLDQNGRPVPPGLPGELYIGGQGVALGYLNRPELTAEKFIDDPNAATFQRANVPTLYRTGDRVRFLPDGNVAFLGRVDNQVKVRGFRVELGEIEAALNQHEAVREGAVIVHEDAPGEKRLVAYVVPGDGREPSGSDLRDFLKETLPDYMVPSLFVIQESLPLTASGKIDRRALPAPDGVQPVAAADYVAPENEIQAELVRMWSDVLHVERIGIHDNFFDLGGHSLMATQLVARVRAEFQVELPLRRLFETPTVAGLTTLIEESLVAAASDEELAQLLAELEDLSPEEVQKLLADEL